MTGITPGSRVCVTGGLGFIGTHLCRELRARGYEVTAVDRLSAAYAAGSGPDHAAGGVRVHVADVGLDPLDAALRDCSAIVHLAGLPGVRSTRPWTDFWRENVLTTARLAAEAAVRGQRFVLASTSSVYGDAAVLPTPEHSPPSPLNPYALSKVAAEAACLRDGTDALVVRLFTVYGPGQRPDMAFSGWIERIARGERIRWCAAPGTRRELTYAEDAARGVVAALERGRAGQAYNIAGSGSWPLADALGLIEEALGTTARVRMEDPSGAEVVVTEACGAKAARELGYAPAVSLEEGLRRQVEAATAAALGARPRAAA